MAEHIPTSEDRDRVRNFLGDDHGLFTDDDFDAVIRIAFRHNLADRWYTAARMLITLAERP